MISLEVRPLITFALFAYNQEKFIADAVQGALSQSYSPLEIILSDDCSSDRTLEIMQAMTSKYNGPNKVIVRQNERNLGLIGHINRVMELVQGELIVVAAGDDVSVPERTENLYKKYIDANGKAICIFSRRWKEIDDKGNSLWDKEFQSAGNSSFDLEYFSKTRHFVPGHSNSWHRSVFDVFGPIDTDVVSEDVVIPFRASILGQVLSMDESLVLRRLHDGNLGGPRTVSTFMGKVAWYKKRHLSLVKNRMGIAKSFLKDMEKARSLYPEKGKQFDKLSRYYNNYLKFNSLAFEYANAGVINRLKIIRQAMIIKMPLTQFALLFFGHYISVLLQLPPINWFYQRYIENRKSAGY